MSKLINLSANCVNHRGEAYKPATSYADILADFLTEAPEGDARKFWNIAQELGEKKKIKIDDSDIDKIIDLLKDSKSAMMLKNGLKGPLLEMLTKARLEEDEDEAEPAEPKLKKAKGGAPSDTLD